MTADSAAAGVETIEKETLDLAIVDLMMEDDDAGFTLCYKAKKCKPELPIIMVTGVGHEAGIEFDTATEEERNWIKADAMLAKPIRFEQLKGEIDRLIG
jgi:DNA-binding response OmpR family regulator